MNKLDLAARLARQSRQSCAKAADQVDILVYNMLKHLKRPADKEYANAADRSSREPSKDGS